MLTSEDDRIRFEHPLLASVIYGSASAERRRQLHKRLALVVSDPEERARHLALCTTEPDEEIAAELEAAAALAARRGAPEAAAELYSAAKRLTPPASEEELTSRGLGEAKALLAAGDIDGARKLASEAAATSAAGLRAEAELILGDVDWIGGSWARAIEHLENAIAARTRRSGARGTRLPEAGQLHRRSRPKRGDRARGASPRGVELRASACSGRLRRVRLVLGRALARARCTPRPLRAVARARGQGRAGVRRRASSPSSTSTRSTTSTPRAIGTPSNASGTGCAVRRGGWRSASRISGSSSSAPDGGTWPSGSSRTLARQSLSSSALVRGRSLFRLRSFVDAGRGRTGRARTTLLPLIDEAHRSGRTVWEALFLSTLAFVEFADDDHAAVDATLTRMYRCTEDTGIRDLVPDRSEPLHVESLVALGEVERARGVLDRLEERGTGLPATLDRCHAATGASDRPGGGGRTREGIRCPRRARRVQPQQTCRSISRGPLSCAADCTAARSNGTRPQRRCARRSSSSSSWARRHGSSGREPSSTASAYAVLQTSSPSTERRVAELAASGLTNREVASKAFMSPKTVQANLARVYRKLGISSRAELGARMSEERRRVAAQT